MVYLLGYKTALTLLLLLVVYVTANVAPPGDYEQNRGVGIIGLHLSSR